MIETVSYPILSIVTFFPLIGVLFIILLKNDMAVRYAALTTTVMNLIISIPIFTNFDKSNPSFQFVETYNWIPPINAYYKMGVDGISILFILLTLIISILCVAVSWSAIHERVKLFYSMILIMETAMIGVFCAMDLLLFYVFYEAMLIPMFLLIGIWGSANRIYASIKFVLFTFAGSVIMLIGIISLYFMAGKTFDVVELSKIKFPVDFQYWLFFAFFAAFAVKVPMFPFHTWLPDAHTEAPTAGSVILAGILLKIGGYGFVRFSIPFCPDATVSLKLFMQLLSLTAIIYGAFVTLMQTDFKRLIAYSSVSHMGFVTLGIFSLNEPAMQGGILQMINHGIVTGALFMCIGVIYERTHTRELVKYGGFGKVVPLFVLFYTFFSAASIGFPGTNSFIGEFLVMLGAFKSSFYVGAPLILGIALGATYMIWLYYRVVFNEVKPEIKEHLHDLNLREALMFIPLVFLVLFIGFQPSLPLSFMDTSIKHLLDSLSTSVNFTMK
ncbi:NADH-quinone oxidoreductase subunit M [Thermodesulfovibrio sp.]|uniref:NADH-quinone oxidoreductase subunit M n=1 Tax=Thermodesulfovibrio sp. TaxID=2067987 RepID=UPI003D11EFFA